MKFGVHVSAAGGLPRAVERAQALGCDCFQIFIGNPRGWQPRLLPIAESDAFREARQATLLAPVVVHLTYLPNLASPDRTLYEKSLRHFLRQYKQAAQLGADYFVLHPGSVRGQSYTKGIRRVAKALLQALDTAPDGPVLLPELMAGGGSLLGGSPEELADIDVAVGVPEKLGVCLDTAHAAAAGFPVHEPGGMALLRQHFRNAFGRHPIRIIHLNDLATPFGKRHDKHQHLGDGTVGKKGIEYILHTPGLRRIPCILETPTNEHGDDKSNLAMARRLSRRRS